MVKSVLRFKKGQTVWVALHGVGITSHEEAVIGLVRRGQVWLDDGPGNPSGPYDVKTGKYLGATVPGFSQELLSEKPKGFKKHR